MKFLKISHIVSILCVGSFAGLLWTFELAVLPMLGTLGATEYARIEQLLITFIDTNFLNAIVVSTVGMLLPLLILIKYRKQRSTKYWKYTFWGWLLFVGVGVFTIVLNVPINEYVLTWDATNPPADWAQARDEWNLLNHIRTPVNYLSFILFIIAGFYIHDLKKEPEKLEV